MPEVLEFFQEHTGDRALHLFDCFLRTFSGTEFSVPGPDFLRDLARDESIVRQLRQDASIENRINILADFGVSYEYLANLWRVCEGKNLAPPDCSTGAGLVALASGYMEKHRGQEREIAQMFGLTAAERAEALGRLSSKPRQVPLTSPQRNMLKFLCKEGGEVTDERIRERYPNSSPEKTVAKLKEKDLIEVNQSGTVKMTMAGKLAIEE